MSASACERVPAVTRWRARRGAVFAPLCLVLLREALCAGGIRILSPTDFAAGTAENLQVTASTMTLVKQWGFGGQAPLAARTLMGFAHDEIRDKTLLFGGKDAADVQLGDTWLWDHGWERRAPAGPPAARYGHALIWAGDRFLLFGGSYGNDTWTYDIVSDTWTHIPASLAPAWRLMPSAAYCPELGKVVMFGGSEDGSTWLYDVAASSWSAFTLNPSPSPRAGASMAYDRKHGKMVLFGGRRVSDGVLLDDTWTFDPAAMEWENMAPVSKPEARWQGAMAYDIRNERAFLYGGLGADYRGDMWFYDLTDDKWTKDQAYYAEPAGRYGHGLVYDARDKSAVLFGGEYTETARSLWFYSFYSSGTWISAPVDAWAGYSSTSPATWDTISAEFMNQPSDTGVLFQIQSSSDGIGYGLFLGPGGSTDTFYTGQEPLWQGHSNRRYIKVKAVLFSHDPPERPLVSALKIGYNRAPRVPGIISPAHNARINDATPLFKWNIAGDPDADWPLLYAVQVDTDSSFSSPSISQENIPAGSAYVQFSTGTEFYEGLWHWRVRAKDPAGLYGEWSSAFSVTIDTHTPPGPVAAMAAARGPYINSALLTWTFPGDDKGRVDNGAYLLRYSSGGPILTEEAWSGAQAEASGYFSAEPEESVQSVAGGLAGGVTYYFSIKTRDELGNLSPLSAVSPFMMSDSSPTVALLSPNGGGLISGATVVAWTQGDANAGEQLYKRILFSSDSGASYSILIASAISPGATYYMWNSELVYNTSAGRIRVIAEDQRGLYSYDSSDSDFSVDNMNEPPSVSFISAPAAGEEVYAGSMTISWAMSDPNSMDTHTYGLLLSVDSGQTFAMFASGLTQTSYTLDTSAFSNLYTYRVKVIATDSGTPELSGAALSPVFSIINSAPPRDFRLLHPLPESYPAIFDLVFAWEPAADPEGGGVTYTLQYSTTAGPAAGSVVSALTSAGYMPPLASLLPDAGYFWKVTAQDPYGKKTESAVSRFIISRMKAKSSDGLLQVEILGGMPPQGFISFQDAYSSRSGLIDQAERSLIGNRLVKPLSYRIWDAQIRDLEGNVLPDETISARITFSLAAGAQPGGLDLSLTDLGHVKITRLNESAGIWDILALQAADPAAKQVSVEVTGLSAFSVIAAITPNRLLSGVTNFPNPFAAGREVTRICYALTADAAVRIRIYTPMGDFVRLLECPLGAAGCGKGDASGIINEMQWDGKNGRGRTVANGIYLAEIYAQSSISKHKEIRRIGVLK